MRFYRRLRRLSWREPPLDPRRQPTNLRARLSLRMARHSRRQAAGLARADLCQSRARLRAVFDAFNDAQPLLPSVPPRRTRRGLAGREILGGAEAPPRSEGRTESSDGAVDRKEHRTAAQFRRRADAVRAAVPRGRRCPYRAADWREGPQPRSKRCLLSLTGADRALPQRLLCGSRRLSAKGPRPHLEGRT